MKKPLLISLLVLAPLLLGGCLSSESEPIEEPPKEQEMDPLTEARKKLFDELGIQEENATTQKESPLPPVLPNPPALPKTDADWPTN